MYCWSYSILAQRTRSCALSQDTVTQAVQALECCSTMGVQLRCRTCTGSRGSAASQWRLPVPLCPGHSPEKPPWTHGLHTTHTPTWFFCVVKTSNERCTTPGIMRRNPAMKFLLVTGSLIGITRCLSSAGLTRMLIPYADTKPTHHDSKRAPSPSTTKICTQHAPLVHCNVCCNRVPTPLKARVSRTQQ